MRTPQNCQAHSNSSSGKVWNKCSRKQKPFFKKLEYRFLVESTKIENTSFPYKTVMPEANVNDTQSKKTQKRLTTRIFKNWSLAASDYIIVYTTN